MLVTLTQNRTRERRKLRFEGDDTITIIGGAATGASESKVRNPMSRHMRIDARI